MTDRSALIDAMARAMCPGAWDDGPEQPSLAAWLRDMALDQARAALAAAETAGWRVVAPPTEEIPEPQPGQVWVAPSPRIEPRTVRAVGPHRSYPWAGDRCVFWESRSKPPHEKWGHACLSPDGWRSWARRTGARPEVRDE